MPLLIMQILSGFATICFSCLNCRCRIFESFIRIIPNHDRPIGTSCYYMFAVCTEFTSSNRCSMGSANVSDVRAVIFPYFNGTVTGSGDEISTIRTDIYATQRSDTGTFNFPDQ